MSVRQIVALIDSGVCFTNYDSLPNRRVYQGPRVREAGLDRPGRLVLQENQGRAERGKLFDLQSACKYIFRLIRIQHFFLLQYQQGPNW